MLFKKRSAAAVLALMMSMGSFGVQVFAEEGDSVTEVSYEDLGNDETSAQSINYSTEESLSYLVFDAETGMITGYVDETPDSETMVNLFIPYRIDGVWVEGIDDEAFAGWDRLEHLKIDSSIEFIGWGAFSNCSNLKTVFIPDTIVDIDSHAFSYTASLEEFTFEENSRLEVMGECVFMESGLEEIIIPESVTNIHQKAFRNCTNLKRVYFEGDAPENLVEDGNAFTGCSEDLVIYYGEGSTGFTSPTWLGHTCQTFSYFKFDRSTQMITGYYDYDYRENRNVPLNLTIPSKIDGINVLGIGDWAFYDWQRLDNVVIEEGIQTIGSNSFKNCESMQSIEIPSTLTEIKDYAFYNDGALRMVIFAEDSQLTAIREGAFSYCSLGVVSIPASVTTLESCAFKCELLDKVYFEGDLPENMAVAAFEYSPEWLTYYYFNGKTGFSDFVGNCEMIDYKIKIDGRTGMITGFIDSVEPIYDNGELQNPINLVIPEYIDYVKVRGIDNFAFDDWERLGSVTISSGMETIGYASFEDCVNIKSLYIPNTVTEIGPYSFCNTAALEELTIEDNSQLAVIDYNAFSLSGINEVTIPASVTNIYENAFSACPNLRSVYFEGNAPQNLEEDQNAFMGCSQELTLYFYEGKTGYQTPRWLGFDCVMIAQGIESGTWNFSNSQFNGLGNITSNITVDGLTILADSGNYVQVKKNTRVFDGVVYDYCLALRGKGTTAYRAVKLNLAGDCVIRVTAASSGDVARTLKVVKADGTVIGEIEAGTSLGIGSVEYTGDGEDIYIYSANSGINIYEIAVGGSELIVDNDEVIVINNDEEETIVEDTTEATTEQTSEESAEEAAEQVSEESTEEVTEQTSETVTDEVESIEESNGVIEEVEETEEVFDEEV